MGLTATFIVVFLVSFGSGFTVGYFVGRSSKQLANGDDTWDEVGGE